MNLEIDLFVRKDQNRCTVASCKLIHNHNHVHNFLGMAIILRVITIAIKSHYNKNNDNKKWPYTEILYLIRNVCLWKKA